MYVSSIYPSIGSSMSPRLVAAMTCRKQQAAVRYIYIYIYIYSWVMSVIWLLVEEVWEYQYVRILHLA